MILRTFTAAAGITSNADNGDASPIRSAKARGKCPVRIPSSDEDDHDDDEPEAGTDDGVGMDEMATPRLSEKARGKLPERAPGLRGSGSSSLSPMTPITPENSQSTSESSRKRQREPKKTSPRKRGRVESDSEYVGDSVAWGPSVTATRVQRQERMSTRASEIIIVDDDEQGQVSHPSSLRQDAIRRSSGVPIEISDSSDEDVDVRPTRRAPAVSSASTRQRQPRAIQKVNRPGTKKAGSSRAGASQEERELPLVPEVEPSPELAAAFEILWSARRKVSRGSSEKWARQLTYPGI